MENGGDEKTVVYHDWKHYRELDWLNHQRKAQNLERLTLAELEELEKYPLVGAHEDGRKAEGALTMSLTSWRRIENSRRAGEAMRARAHRFCEDPPSEPERKRRRKPRSGGARSRLTAKAKAEAATEALEAAQGEAVEAAAAASYALEAAQGEAAAEESLRLTASKELKKVQTKLNKVRKVASSHASWVNRPSTQLSRYVPEPRVMVVLRGALSHDLCDSVNGELLAKKGWINQGGDNINAGGYSSTRFQVNVPKPKPTDKLSAILRKFSAVLHFTCAKGHTHLRSPCAMKGGSVQRWHLDNGHGRSLSLLAALTDRVFEYAAVGGGITKLALQKGDCLLFTSWVWHRGVDNPADSVAFFAYFDDEKFEVPPPTSSDYSAAQDDNRAGFKRMLDDDQWDELNEMYADDPQSVTYVEFDAAADDGALDKLPTILGRAFKYEEDYTSCEL
jgi:hypothetical protein